MIDVIGPHAPLGNCQGWEEAAVMDCADEYGEDEWQEVSEDPDRWAAYFRAWAAGVRVIEHHYRFRARQAVNLAIRPKRRKH